MISRDLFVCKCATSVPRLASGATRDVDGVRWLRGDEEHLSLLSPGEHRPHQIEELRARLRRGEHWVLGVSEGHVVSYTWLHTRSTIDFPYLPGCTFRVAAGVAYGYDAWTPSELRGRGFRRRAFLEELHVLNEMGMEWEASFFAQHQIDGARRSLAMVGIDIIPLWRTRLVGRTLSFERIAEADESAMPIAA